MSTFTFGAPGRIRGRPSQRSIEQTRRTEQWWGTATARERRQALAPRRRIPMASPTATTPAVETDDDDGPDRRGDDDDDDDDEPPGPLTRKHPGQDRGISETPTKRSAIEPITDGQIPFMAPVTRVADSRGRRAV